MRLWQSRVPTEIPTLEWLGFPTDLAERIVHRTNGLVLFTGITGSGKTSSMAALVNLLNDEGGYRIITIEEPVEYVFPKNDRSVVSQREVGVDVPTFDGGLRFALRQDPDVILVGELRDLETMETALTAAETGHLVFATLHTQDAPGSVERMIDVFPPHQQQQVRVQLASSLQGVVSQQLLPRVDTEGRSAAAVAESGSARDLAHLVRAREGVISLRHTPVLFLGL